MFAVPGIGALSDIAASISNGVVPNAFANAGSYVSGAAEAGFTNPFAAASETISPWLSGISSGGQTIGQMAVGGGEAAAGAAEVASPWVTGISTGGSTIGELAVGGGEAASLAGEAAIAGEAAAGAGGAAAGGGALSALGPLAAVAAAGYGGFKAGNWLAENTAAGDVATDAVGGLDSLLTGKGERSALLRASEWVGDKTDAVSGFFGGLF